MSTEINLLKSWYITNAKPTQEQFAALIDSFRHKDDKIVYDNLSDELKDKLQSIPSVQIYQVVMQPGVYIWEVPEGILVQKILIMEPSNPTVKIGTEEDGEEYMSERLMENGWLVYANDLPFPEGGNIYFSGLTINSIVKIFIG